MDETPPDNARLKDLLSRLAGGASQTLMEEFWRELLRSRLIVPMGDEEKGEPSGVVAHLREDGEKGILAFTDPASLGLWRPTSTRLAAIPAQGLFQMAWENEFCAVVLNPAGPEPRDISRREMEALARGHAPAATETEQGLVRVEMRTPASPPPQAMDHVRQVLARVEAIASGHFLDMAVGREPWELCLVLRSLLPLDRWGEVLERLADLERVPGLPNGFNVVPWTPEIAEGVSRHGLEVLKR